MPDDGAVATFVSAARSFAALVRDLPEDRWDGPGLGEWDLRSLVGHTSRSPITVSTYLQSSAEREDVATAQDYYVRVSGLSVERALSELARTDDRLIAVIGGLGIRLHTYLVTRTFELAVHGLDTALAADIRFTLPDEVLGDATVLAARIATAIGEGQTVLLSLTGRTALPPSFSVV